MIKLCAQFARQQVIQSIAKSYQERVSQDLPPHTVGRLKNRFNTPETQEHLKFITELFQGHPDDSLVIVDKGGYIAAVPKSRILAARVKI